MPERVTSVRMIALGGFRIIVDGRDVRLRTRKEAMLLLRLALGGEDGVTRDECIGLLWPESSEAKARHSLSEALRGIELATGRAIARNADRLSVPPDSCTLDVRDLNDAIGRGDVCECARLHTGGFLAGWYPPTAEASHWADGVAASIATRLEKMLRRELVAKRQATDSRGVTAAVALLEQLGVATQQDLEAGAEAEEITGWEGLRPGDSVQSRIPLDREGRFVGRVEEMKILTRELERAMNGELRVVLVSGEAGIGKTRICQRLARVAALRGARLFLSNCHELEQSVPYQAVVDSLRDSLKPDDLDLLPVHHREAIDVLVRELGYTSGHYDAASRGHESKNLDKRTVLDAINAILQAAGTYHPLFINIDDLQWADASSCQALHYLLRRFKPSRGALFVAAHRREDLHRNSAASALIRSMDAYSPTILELGSVPTDELRLQLQELWPHAQEHIDDVLELAAGNPFFARELAMAAALGRADYSRGSLAEVITSRGDDLPTQARAALDLVAVWGSPMTLLQLSRIAEQNVTVMARSVAHLRKSHLIMESGAEVTMAHELTRDAFYAALPEPVKRSMHGAIAFGMESEGPAPFLAHHFAMGGVRDRARKYALISARASREKKAFEEELRWLLLALDNTDDCLPDMLENVVGRLFSLALYAEVRKVLATFKRHQTPLLRMKGELAVMKSAIAREDTYQALLNDCDSLHENAARQNFAAIAIEALRTKMRFAQESIDTGTTLRVAEDLIRYGRESGNLETRLQAEAIALMKMTSFRPNVVDERLACLRNELAECGASKSLVDETLAVTDALNDYNQGRLRQAGLSLHRLILKARSARNLGEEVRLRALAVPLNTETARFKRALRHGQFVIDWSRLLETSWERWLTTLNLASCQYEMGNFSYAARLSQDAIATQHEYPMWLLRIHPLAILGLCALEEGNLDAATRRSDAVREILPPAKDWIGDVSYAIALLARVEARRGNRDAAVELINAANECDRGLLRIVYWNLDLEYARLGVTEPNETIERLRALREDARRGSCRLVVNKADALLRILMSGQVATPHLPRR